MSNKQLYANGTIAVLSNKLLGQDKFARLAECSNLGEALKVLGEFGYGNGVTLDDSNDYESLLRAQMDDALRLFEQLCTDQNAKKYFLCRYDYLNAKICMKSKYMRADGTHLCFSCLALDAQQMYKAFLRDDYSVCSPNMATACDQIDAQFANGNRNAQVVDVTLDKAMFADMRKYANGSSLSIVKQMYAWQVDTTNLMCLSRAKKAGYSAEKLQQMLLKGVNVSEQTLAQSYLNGDENVDLPLQYKEFFALCNQNGNLLQAEQRQQDVLYDMVAQQTDFATIQPAIKFLLDKVKEIDKIRHVLVQIKSATRSNN